MEGDKNEVIGMVCADKPDSDILVVSENGFGKRSALEDYRITNRGGKGVKTINITEKTGELIAILGVDDDHDFMIINRSGITIRLRVDELRVVGRATQGVKLINLRGSDSIAAICSVMKDEEEPTDALTATDQPSTDGGDENHTPDTNESTDPAEQ